MVVSAGIPRTLLRKLMGNRLAAACALILACCPLLAAQTPRAVVPDSEIVSGPASPAASASLALPDYIISPADVLIVSVYDSPDISGEYRVSPAGQIELPLLSEAIVAAGLTPAQLSEHISEKYRKAEIYSHPRVTVAVKESRVHSITVAGAVKTPQIYPLFGKATLLDVLSQAQGLANDAGGTALITRGGIAMQALKQSGECESAARQAPCAQTFTVDLKQLEETGDPAFNVDLYPGDRVTVQRAGIVYVVGAVNRPGGFPLKTGQVDMTVLQALALAEDLKPTAARKKAMIMRKSAAAPNGREEIAVNLKNVLEGREADPRLQANDILFVADSTGKRALRRGAEAAIYTTTSLLIWHW
ncbi:MAG: polysaccharide biosynthesis/export family protein [Acidobacteriia bacterium]|nr:polysaccharide biosynthesis/export family protein [Terriglobia bacterium]